ncbi:MULTISPECIES: 3-hydroxyacyl-CoA dehydrogenase NAD-binding domain-containing protein [unclassified Micromonospora]|uniref:3-hydroxyacyl-CoA dehydrogenase NAD-binding domain-containing protein n=1 Tax=unclassified Micromonospora TaxID=2617518 RepID=UPI0003EEA3C5|nr:MULTISPECIES: 3-hydroxyacyl-CoA dehydrogenase NAD-binding domain-containing protein [unclassified Micromonospora]EWM65206.1 fatty acid oxidation complex alpha-subunit [Micromonospora sp. M42]MCK1808028.1 3-hydroxyacyl-CoA dehydrogenase NAD-binding domain-containing protein [Micromonospora sp. R42106]MCK1833950.1 3-hydroxyacyl-CoA dehydrogenase NAD-binding domain-containing protein [Micromonospora sp. R42003]MCK1845838.1 3-hydroxyacyl-CoA dehydrogenase NAD-binding domain-containing protein [M
MSALAAPNEVVTKALLRQVAVPGLDRPAALITLDNGFDHTKPNSFGPGGLTSLDEAITAALAAEPAFIAVTGKPYIFCVGADITSLPALENREQALEIGRLGHRVFARLKDSAVPTFAFVNGAAMGGGLELALHCHYRTLSAGAAALALPEVSLGLIPGWGGTQLLPNLIGIPAATQVIIQNPLMQNKMLKPKQAAEMGIADVLLEPADFLERSLEWAAGVVRGEVTVTRPEVDKDMWAGVLYFARQTLDQRLHGAVPSAYKALDLLETAKDADFATGTAAEDEALADLVFSEELRSGLYAFDLVQRRAKRPAGAPDKGLARPVTKVGIVGAGLMASQLALLFARRLQVPVVMTDLDQSRVDKGVGYVHTQIEKAVSKGRMDKGTAAKLYGLVSGSVDKSVFADADFVIEAVFEDLGVKKQVWAELEKIVKPEAVLATNTSSLSITEMAAELEHPERVVGFHFFNPVAVLPLLEIVRGERTDDATLATAFAVGKQLKKSSVLVKDAPAFVVNRLLTRFLGTVFAAVDQGTPLDVANSALDPLGLPMRPLALLQLVGPAVAYHVGGTLHEAFPDRFGVSENLKRIADSGKPIVVDDQINDEVAKLLVVGDEPLTGEQVRQNALDALAQEIRLMLDEGVVAEAQDIDLCMILGAGWPFHLGGVTPYLDRTGTSERVTGKRFLPRGVASLR